MPEPPACSRGGKDGPQIVRRVAQFGPGEIAVHEVEVPDQRRVVRCHINDVGLSAADQRAARTRTTKLSAPGPSMPRWAALRGRRWRMPRNRGRPPSAAPAARPAAVLAHLARDANRAIPSARLGPVMIGLGFSDNSRSSHCAFPQPASSAPAALPAMADATRAALVCKNVRRLSRAIACSFHEQGRSSRRPRPGSILPTGRNQTRRHSAPRGGGRICSSVSCGRTIEEARTLRPSEIAADCTCSR